MAETSVEERPKYERLGGEPGVTVVVSSPPTTAAVLGERDNEKSGAESGGGGGDRSSSGNRWPREETLALLSIRHEMDAAFRDASAKSPLWDEVSRRLAELGYHRNAKKCKEKFENVYKYHKRTKRYQSSRSNGKSYRFFDQLEALDHHDISSPSSGHEQGNPAATTVATMPRTSMFASPQPNPENITPFPIQEFDANFLSTSTSTASSSGNECEGSRKKKRKWEAYFDKLMGTVLERQADLQNKFLEALEKCERDRIAREEAWKAQELDRIRRERELLMQEREIAAAKDATVLAFLEKVLEKGKGSVEIRKNPSTEEKRSLVQVPQVPTPAEETVAYKQNGTNDNVNDMENSTQAGSARWPKDEVDALIRLRTNMEVEQQDTGPKGSLWEEISAAMKKLGYDRNAKRCKEKWENINKYFRRVKESNKKRPLDSKTCPYFHQLEALYQRKVRKLDHNSENPSSNLRPEELLLHMMNHQPDQQQQPPQQGQGVLATDHKASAGIKQRKDDQVGYQIVASDGTSSMTMME